MDKKTKRKFPCLFVHEGAIKMYDKSMIVFHTKVTVEEWMLIVEETIRYYNFILALKEVGMPRLGEKWTKLCEYFLKGLEVNVARMRNLDPLLVARTNQEELLATYKAKMETNSVEVLAEIQQVRDQMTAQEGTTVINLNIVSDM